MLRRWAPFVGPLLVLAVYVRILGGPLVWDDRHLILDAPNVTSLQPIASYFGHAFWNSPETGDLRGYYRPLTILSFALEHHLHGANPAAFHLTNVVLHAINVVLLYLLLRRFRVSPAIALLLDLLWALHPRLTEAVCWISGRTDVLATTFVLGALLVHRPQRPGRLAVASLLVLLGLLSKEVAVAGVVALLALELAPARTPTPSPWGRRAAFAMIPLGAAVVYWVLRSRALGVAPQSLLPTSLGQRVLLAAEALGSYARMALVPWRPELQIGDVWVPQPALAVAGVLVLLLAVAVVARARRLWLEPSANVRPLVVIGSALAAVGLGVVLHLVPIAVNVIAADRFCYLPMAGAVLLLAPCLQARALRSPRKLALLGALAVSFAGASFVRVGDWCSEIELWSKTYRQAPKENGLPANELGNVYYRAGLFEEARDVYAQAARNLGAADSPWASHMRAMTAANRAAAVSQLGDYASAGRALSLLCEQQRSNAEYCLDAGLVELHRLRFDAARSWIRIALERAPEYGAAKEGLEAVARVEAIARAVPANPIDELAARFHVAELAGRRPDALRLGEAVLALPRAPRPLRREAAEYWAKFGPPAELRRVLAAPTTSDVVDGSILGVIDLRVQTAGELLRAWPSLGIPKAEPRARAGEP